MTTMTHTDTTSLLGRALDASMLVAGARPRAAATACARAQALTVYATTGTAPNTPTRNAATAVATNPWLGGFGSGEGMGNGASTFVDHSTKRIHPGRLEGMT